MRIQHTFSTASIPDAVRFIVQETDVLPLGPEDYATFITVHVARTSAGRSVSARIAKDIYDPAQNLELWINTRTSIPWAFTATEAGQGASVRRLLLELTQHFAPQFTDAVADGLSPERWQLADYFSGLPIQAGSLPPLEGMTFERFKAEMQRVGNGYIILRFFNGERGLLWLMPEAPHHKVGVQLTDGRFVTIPLNWVVAVEGLAPNNWLQSSGVEQQICKCTHERQFGKNGLCDRCGYEIQFSYAPKRV
jgi:hypothetical protein